MNYKMRHNIYAEARAVLSIQPPLVQFRPDDIGSFVIAYSGIDTACPIPGVLESYGIDRDGQYCMVKPFVSENSIRYTLVAKMPEACLPIVDLTVKEPIFRDNGSAGYKPEVGDIPDSLREEGI